MEEMAKELEEAIAKLDSVVLKRLRFVHKIIKGKCVQPNNRNRQAPAYLMEVFDTISDWSGNGEFACFLGNLDLTFVFCRVRF